MIQAAQQAEPVADRLSGLVRMAGWVALAAAVLVTAWGIHSNGLLRQTLWTPSGLRRLAVVAIGYAIWSLVFLSTARSWFVPATAGAVLLLTAAAVGPVPVLAVLFFLFSSFVTGALLLREREPQGLTPNLLQCLLGVSVWMAVFGAAVHFPINYGAVYAAALVTPLAMKPKLTLACLGACARIVRPLTLPTLADHASLALAGFPVLCHLLVTFKPEMGTDALATHLMIPSWISFQHYWAFDFRHIAWAVMPLGADWCFTAAYLLGGEFSARLLNFSFLAVITTLVFAASRRSLGRGTAFLFAGLFASTPLVQLITGSLFVENLWAALLFGTVLALDRFHHTAAPRWLYTAAVLLGAALATKFGTAAFLVPVAAFAGWELVTRRKASPGALRVAAIAVCLVLLFGAPPYVFAYAKTGNPVFPFMNHVFKSPWFDATAPLVDARYALPLSLATPYEIAFRTHKYLEGRDGALGFHYLVLLALAVAGFSRRWPYLGWLAFGISLASAGLSFAGVAYLRYLYPALPLAMVVGAVALGRLRAESGVLFRAALATLAAAFVLNIYFLPSSGWYHPGFVLNPRNASEVEEHYRRFAPVRRTIEYLNRAHPGEPVAFFGTGHIAGLRARAYVADWQNERYLNRVRTAATPAGYGRLAQSLGLKWFIAPASWTGTASSHSVLSAFLARYTESEYTFGAFDVRRMKPNAPAEWAQENSQSTAGPCDPEMLDDTSPKLRYSGPWQRVYRFGNACEGTLTYSDSGGAEVALDFTGTSVTYVFTKAYTRGMAEITLDGARRDVLNLYSPRIEWRSRVSFGGLAPGPHTLTIRVLRKSSAESEGYAVDVDGFLIGP